MLTFEKLTHLRGSRVFRDLDDSVLLRIAQVADADDAYPDELILRTGDEAGELYLVAQGRVRVVTGGGSRVELGPGEVFGEIDAFDPGPRSADVVAVEPTRLLRLSSAALIELIDEHPTITLRLLEHLARRLRGSDPR